MAKSPFPFPPKGKTKPAAKGAKGKPPAGKAPPFVKKGPVDPKTLASMKANIDK